MGMDKDAEVSNGGSCSMVGEATNFAKPTEKQEQISRSETMHAPYQDTQRAARDYHNYRAHRLPKRPEIVEPEDEFGFILIG